MTVAKGISNATVPMGGVFVRKPIYDGLMQGPENAVDLFHGYTYSAHPLACAAASAVLDIYRDEALFERSAELSPYWEAGRAFAEGPAQRHRHPQSRPCRRHRPRTRGRRSARAATRPSPRPSSSA